LGNDNGEEDDEGKPISGDCVATDIGNVDAGIDDEDAMFFGQCIP
jgi:hypothetical protein